MVGIKFEDLRADQNLNLPPRLPKTALIRAVDLRSERDLDGSKGMVYAHIIAQIKIPKVQIFLRNSLLSEDRLGMGASSLPGDASRLLRNYTPTRTQNIGISQDRLLCIPKR